MFYYKRLLSSLFVLTLITTLSACSTTATNQQTKETTQKASNVPTQKVAVTPAKKIETKAQKAKAQNQALIQVNQQLDELFTPAIGLF